VVGTADLGGSTTDNLHLADLEIHVRPEWRRRGIGRILDGEAAQRLRDEGRTSVCGEVHVPPGSGGDGVAAYAFAAAMGFEPVHAEDHCC
jgi:GNAT superfamily N-acetyltransferase